MKHVTSETTAVPVRVPCARAMVEWSQARAGQRKTRRLLARFPFWEFKVNTIVKPLR